MGPKSTVRPWEGGGIPTWLFFFSGRLIPCTNTAVFAVMGIAIERSSIGRSYSEISCLHFHFAPFHNVCRISFALIVSLAFCVVLVDSL